MILEALTAIGGFISKPITQVIQNRGEIAKAKVAKQVRIIDGTQSWEEKQADQAGDSWKDEYLTLFITIPFILCFIAAFTPESWGILPKLNLSIELAATLPDEYWYLMTLVFSATFAAKAAPKVIAKIRNIKAAAGGEGPDNGKGN